MEKEEKVEQELKEETKEEVKENIPDDKAMEEQNEGIDDISDDDFADAKKEEVKEEPAEVAPVEEKKEEEVNLRKEKEEGDVEAELEPTKRNEKGNIEYSDNRLAEVEKARRQWNKQFKKWSMWKMILTIGSFVIIVAAYLIPTLINKDWTQIGLYIALGCAIAAIAGFIVFGVFQRKAHKKMIHDYFVAYYENVNAYTFEGLNITDISGDFDTKISEDEFKACGMYPNVASLGSRESLTFKYEGVDAAISDVGAQKDTGKALQTVFVGKYLRMENKLDVSEEGLIIYFKGNDRAIPPDAIKGLKPIENNKKFVIYGLNEDKKVLTPEIRSKLKEIKTDSLLVDVAISLRPGKTYFALGYEDTLMVLPNDKPFDPVYVTKYKEQLKFFLDLGLVFNK